jgi:hypothetical protein
MTPPQDKQTLMSFLGLVNYMKKYSCALSEIAKPLRMLLKEDAVWCWESAQEESFQEIKRALPNTPILAYFHKDAKEHVIQTDASMKGLGGVLLQDGRPVQYISRTLTPTEQNYSNIERELLGVVFGLERLHNFVYGAPIIVETDHKPLESLINKNVSDISPRLQRLMLRLHKYNIKLRYLQGQKNVIADALSRVSPLLVNLDEHNLVDLVPLHSLTSSVPATYNRMDECRVSTHNDLISAQGLYSSRLA